VPRGDQAFERRHRELRSPAEDELHFTRLTVAYASTRGIIGMSRARLNSDITAFR
jgi:hypothetical protein